MAERQTPGIIMTLTTRERILLFCVASDTNWLRAGITREVITALIERGLLARDERAHLALTDDGRAALRALLPAL